MNVCLIDNNKKYYFNLKSIYSKNGNNFIFFEPKKKIYINSSNFLIEIEKSNTTKRLFHLKTDISQLNIFIKNNLEFYQQEYIFNQIKVILRYDKKFILKELVYKY